METESNCSYRAVITSRTTEESLIDITLTFIANTVAHIVANTLNSKNMTFNRHLKSLMLKTSIEVYSYNGSE